MKLTFDISATEFETVRDILADIVPTKCRVWVFGSRAENQPRFNSDLDLALEGKDKLPPIILHKLKEAFSDAPLPYRVDVLDINDVSKNFQAIIRPQAIAFPLAKSAKVPKLRFKDAQGKAFPEWVEKEFRQFAKKVSDSYNPVTSSENWQSVELESLGQGNGKILKTFSAQDLQSIKTKFRKDDVLFGKLRPYLRKFAHVEFDGVCTSEIWVLRANGMLGKFLYFVVQSNRFNQFANIQSGSKMPRSDWKIVSSAKFLIPTLPEQQKIADFLSAIDRKIDLVTTELTQAQTFKKGVMQQMFV